MLRGRLKSAGARALHASGLAGGVGRVTGSARLPLVIGYHRVVDDFAAQARGYVPAMLASTAMLEKQLDWIGRRFTFVDPNDMGDWLAGVRPGGRLPALITFDDGYRDVYENALPLLKRKGIPAAVFVVTDLVGTERLQLHDELFLLLSHAFPRWQNPGRAMTRVLEAAQVDMPQSVLPPAGEASPQQCKRALQAKLPQAARRRVVEMLRRETALSADATAGLKTMNWGMLAELCDAGIRVGSHTCRHALLTSERSEVIEKELRESRRVLEDRLHVDVRHFAYPDGRFDERVVAGVAGAGYRFGFTTCRHRDSRFPALTIPRRLLWEQSCVDSAGHFSPSVMSCQVNGAFDCFARCRMQHAA